MSEFNSKETDFNCGDRYEELINALQVLDEIYMSTRNNINMPYLQLYLLKQRYRTHLNNLCFCGSSDLRIYIPVGQSSAKEEYGYAIMAVKNLWRTSGDDEAPYLKAKAIAHMENMIYMQCFMNLERGRDL